MKKLLLVSLSTLFVGMMNAQTVVFSSSFENWAGTPEKPVDWFGTKTTIPDSLITKVAGSQFGIYAVQIENTTTSISGRRFTTIAQTIEPATTYTIKFWAKGSGQIISGLWTGATDNKYLYGTAGSSVGVAVNTSTLTEYSNTVDVNVNASDAEFILTVKAGTGTTGTVEIDSVVITSGTSAPPVFTSIYDIQYTTNADSTSTLFNQTVNTGGIISAIATTPATSQNFWINTSTGGAWSGIKVYCGNTLPSNIAIGDSVTFTGVVDEYTNTTNPTSKETELKSLTNFTIINSNNTIAQTLIPTNDGFKKEKYEGVLVSFQNATVTDAINSFGEYKISDGSGKATIDTLLYNPLFILNGLYDVTGVVSKQGNLYNNEVYPRFAADVVLKSNADLKEINTSSLVVYPNIVTDLLNVQNSNGVLEILSIDGKIMTSLAVKGNAAINVSSYPAGVYFLQVNGQAIKFIKN